MENIIPYLQENTDTDHEYYISYDSDDCFEPSNQDNNNYNSYYTYTVNTILNGAARLRLLFPTATILIFTVFAPLITNGGECTTLDGWLITGATVFLATSCVFFSIMDSYRAATGRLYYEVATFHGIRTFGRGRARMCGSLDYRLRWGDAFRTLLSLVAFLAFAMLQNDVLKCYHVVLPTKFIGLAPLVVGCVISLMFVLFP
ncbi:hypothetical protein OROMI_030775 [Orobanche minor]